MRRRIAADGLSRKTLTVALAEGTGFERFDSANNAAEALEAPAFKRPAVDNLLKPFSHERIQEAWNGASRRTDGEHAGQLEKIVSRLEVLLTKSKKIAIKTKGKILFIDPAEVATVEAQGNYVLLQRDSGSYLLREKMSAMAERLQPYGFIRIHRSVLVNGSFVEEIRPWTTGEYVLLLKGGKEFTVSRTYKGNLTSITRLWIGMESLVAG
jgi:DNA-binding LytR/AlgR family response regulator